MSRGKREVTTEEYISYKPKNYDNIIKYGYPTEDDRIKDDEIPVPEEPMTFKKVCLKVWECFKIAVIILSLAFIMYIFNGCAKAPEPQVKTIVRTETQEVKVPVMPKIPELYCDFEGVGLEPTRKLLACLIYHKRVLSALRSGKIDLNNPSMRDEIDNYLKTKYPNDEAAKIGKILDDNKTIEMK